jgi:hypothetical protein
LVRSSEQRDAGRSFEGNMAAALSNIAMTVISGCVIRLRRHCALIG